MLQIVPIDNSPNQTMQVRLSVDDGVLVLTLKFSFNEEAGYWVMGIVDAETGEYLVDPIPLLTHINFLGPYAYLNLGSAFLLDISGVGLDYPGADDFGVNYLLYWGDTQA